MTTTPKPSKHFLKAQLRIKVQERDRQEKYLKDLHAKREKAFESIDAQIAERKQAIERLNAEITNQEKELNKE